MLLNGLVPLEGLLVLDYVFLLMIYLSVSVLRMPGISAIYENCHSLSTSNLSRQKKHRILGLKRPQ